MPKSTSRGNPREAQGAAFRKSRTGTSFVRVTRERASDGQCIVRACAFAHETPE